MLNNDLHSPELIRLLLLCAAVEPCNAQGSILSTIFRRDMSQHSKLQNVFFVYSTVSIQDFPDWKINILVRKSPSVATCSSLSLSKKKTLLPLIESSNTVSPFGKSTDTAGPFLETPWPAPLHLIPAKLVQKQFYLLKRGSTMDCHPCIITNDPPF